MDIAWPAIVILVMLLPGFFFFVGLYSRELYGRDASARDVVSKLAPIVFVSFVAHAILTLTGHLFSRLPVVDLRLVLSAVAPEADGSVGLHGLARDIENNLGWIIVYVLTSCGLGAWGGRITAGLVIAGKWKLGVAHPWAYELVARSDKEFNPTYAFVLTKLQRGKAHELYRGPLDRFGLYPDGRFSYLVLLEPEKCHVTRDKDGTTTNFYWKEVGESTGAPIRKRLLYVDMREVGNAVFEKYPGITGLKTSKLLKALEARRAELSQSRSSGDRSG